MNPLFYIDGYKLDHRRQYPANTTKVYSNFTPRGSRIPSVTHVTFFGLQYFLQKYLGEEFDGFFAQPIDVACENYAKRVNGYLGPNVIGTEHIKQLHELGYVPLEFKALPEGTQVPLRCPMFTVENTHPDFAWLVNYVETILSATIWLPCTSATNARRLRRLLNKRARSTVGSTDFVGWQGHDFSFRGMGGLEAACLSGAGHLTAFTGTDTMPALEWIEKYYGVPSNYLLGGSVAATEHSVMCAGGALDEFETYKRLLSLYPGGIVSIVSDTWDLWNVITNILPSLKTEIMKRDGKLVIRPDSGNPADILCGDPNAKPFTPESKGVVQLLHEIFGGKTNLLGFVELDPHVGTIYGDSINYDRADEITKRLQKKGYASTNVVFGVGSYTYQHVTRDTFGFAMKATYCEINGEGRDMFKQPVTDSGEKFSAVGKLSVVKDSNGELCCIERANVAEERCSLLQTVWKDSTFMKRVDFPEVRARVLEGI